MFIFGRSRTAAPAHARAAMAMAIEAAERAKQVAGLQMYPWTTMFSPGVGTLVWSARAESLEELETAADKWAGDGPTMDWVEQNDHLFEGPTNDALTEVIHGTPGGEPGPYVAIVQAQWAQGKWSAAMAVGAEIVDAFSRITGHNPLFGRSVTGAFAGVSWITSFPDIGASAAADTAVATDAGWSELMDRATVCYLPGATSVLLRRLA